MTFGDHSDYNICTMTLPVLIARFFSSVCKLVYIFSMPADRIEIILCD